MAGIATGAQPIASCHQLFRMTFSDRRRGLPPTVGSAISSWSPANHHGRNGHDTGCSRTGRGGSPPGGPPGGRGGGRGGGPDWNVTVIPVGRGAEGFDLSPDGKELWAANAQDANVSLIDVATKKVVQTVPVPFRLGCCRGSDGGGSTGLAACCRYSLPSHCGWRCPSLHDLWRAIPRSGRGSRSY